MDKKIIKILCKNKKMKAAYKEGKDLYSTLASILFRCDYSECLEYKNDVPYVEGCRKRRIAKLLFAGFYFNEYEIFEGVLI